MLNQKKVNQRSLNQRSLNQRSLSQRSLNQKRKKLAPLKILDLNLNLNKKLANLENLRNLNLINQNHTKVLQKLDLIQRQPQNKKIMHGENHNQKILLEKLMILKINWPIIVIFLKHQKKIKEKKKKRQSQQ
jgi:hypothetical protein